MPRKNCYVLLTYHLEFDATLTILFDVCSVSFCGMYSHKSQQNCPKCLLSNNGGSHFLISLAIFDFWEVIQVKPLLTRPPPNYTPYSVFVNDPNICDIRLQLSHQCKTTVGSSLYILAVSYLKYQASFSSVLL